MTTPGGILFQAQPWTDADTARCRKRYARPAIVHEEQLQVRICGLTTRDPRTLKALRMMLAQSWLTLRESAWFGRA